MKTSFKKFNQQARVAALTPTLDTNIYASGDVLAVATELSLYPANHGTGIDWIEVTSLTVVDEDDQGVALDVLFFGEEVTMGTINGAISISDADIVKCAGAVEVAAGDFVDLTTGQVATSQFNPIPVALTGGSLWVALVSRGTGTYSADGITLNIGYKPQNRGE